MSACFVVCVFVPRRYPPDAKQRLLGVCATVRKACPQAWSPSAARMVARIMTNIDANATVSGRGGEFSVL